MDLQCKPSTIKPVILRCARVQRPVFIWGPPGIGKSDLVSGITEDMGNSWLIDLRLALMEPTDLRGYPFRNPETNTMEWAPPVDLPTEEFASQYDWVVLFLDELNSAPPSVQAAAYQLILNRRIGQYSLPKNVIIIAAGNRENDRGVTYRMPAPLANRFRHVSMTHDFDDWQRWALNNGIHREVIGYLNSAKQDLFDFDPKSSSTAFATPRSWTYVSESLYDPSFDTANPTEQRVDIASSVGEGIAGKFLEQRRLAGRMPNPADILGGKVTKLDPSMKNEISAKYSLVVGLAYEINEGFKASGIDTGFRAGFNHAVRFSIDNFEPEMVILLFKTILGDYKIKFNLRKDLDKDLSKAFNDRYIDYLVD